MASGRQIRAGQAFVEIGGKDKLTKMLDRIGRRAKQFGQALVKVFKAATVATTALTVAAAGALKVFADLGDEIQKAGLRTGFTAEQMSALKHAADEADVSFEALVGAIFRLQRETGGRTTLAGLADEIAALEDPAKQAELAYKLLGRRGEELMPLLKQGSAGFREAANEASRLGLIMSQETAEAAAELKDASGGLGKQLKQLVGSMGAVINESGNVTESISGSAVESA